jgi:hypothetical protein
MSDTETPDSKLPPRFGSIRQADLPSGRNGRHKAIVQELLSDLQQLGPGEALKVPLAELPDTKVNIRSALNRATQQLGIEVATSSDAEHLYIWKPDGVKLDGTGGN